ncbi:MAG: hypothetical protein V4693_20665 [Pseudomonadota bacterium]
MHLCPDCGSDFTRRIKRSWWMRLLLTSRHILCTMCGARSLLLWPSRKRRAERTPVRQLAEFRKNRD